MTCRLVLPVASLAVVAVGAFAFAPSREVHAPAVADSWTIDGVHSSLIFRVKHLDTAPFYGRFNSIAGQIVWDDANPSGSSFNVEVQTASVDTANEGRNRHLRGTDFFNADQFPVCTFKSTSVKPSGDGFELAGDLTINGQTKPVTAKLEKTGQGTNPRGGGAIIGFEVLCTIKRSDFGVNYMPGGLGDEVKLFIGLEAGKK